MVFVVFKHGDSTVSVRDIRLKPSIYQEYISKKIKTLPPVDPVRLEIYKLEKKGKVPRKHGEIVESWFERISQNQDTTLFLKELYNKVRYGEVAVSKEEVQLFKDTIRKMK